MNALTHDQVRRFLDGGREYLNTNEQAALARHLTECAECENYSVELNALQPALASVMRTRWDAARAAPELEQRVQARVHRILSRQRIFSFIGSFATVGVIISMGIIALLIFQPDQNPSFAHDAFNAVLTQVANLAPDESRPPCPTPVPPPLLATPRTAPTVAPPTAVPPATRDPNATPRPTRTPHPPRIPRPTPTITFLPLNGQWATYRDPQYGFSFEYPALWELTTSHQAIGLRGVPPDEDSINIQNYSSGYPTDDTPDVLRIWFDYSPAMCGGASLQAALRLKELVAEVTPFASHAPIDNLPAFRRTVRYAGPIASHDVLEVIATKGKWLYIFHADPADSKYLAVFERLLASFRIQ